MINNKYVSIPPEDEPASVIDQRVYVPLRVVSEGLGAEVAWCPETRQVVIASSGGTDQIPSDPTRDRSADLQIVIDGKVLDIPPGYGEVRVAKATSRVIVPLRAVGEALGCWVEWSVEKRRVEILSGSAYPEPSRGDEPTPAPSALLQDLASYRTNLRLLDGTVINSAELLARDESSFSETQLEQFETYLSLLTKYERIVELPDGSRIAAADLAIEGRALADADQLQRWLAAEEPRLRVKMAQCGREFVPIPDDLADLYLRIGEEYGIRGDLAFCQAAKETCFWQFVGSVQPFQNNYCGLWATGSPCTGQEPLNGADPDLVRFEPGVHGAIFADPEVGVEAHIQHLYAYACRDPLPRDRVLYDPRFNLVARGCAPTWQGLNARWAVPGTTYGQSIIQDWWLPALDS